MNTEALKKGNYKQEGKFICGIYISIYLYLYIYIIGGTFEKIVLKKTHECINFLSNRHFRFRDKKKKAHLMYYSKQNKSFDTGLDYNAKFLGTAQAFDSQAQWTRIKAKKSLSGSQFLAVK